MIDQRLNCCIHSTAPCSLDAWQQYASQTISVTKRDRRRFRLENEIVAAKNVVVRKIEKVVSGSRGLQKTELQTLLLGVVM